MDGDVVGTYVSFDDSLNTAVRKLPALFDDSADNPRFIETVPKRGYRFIAPVTRIVDGATGLDAGGLSLLEAKGSGPSGGRVNALPPLNPMSEK